MSLTALRIPPEQGPLPTAEQHNGVLDHLLRNRIVGAVEDAKAAASMRHPWKVRVGRFEERSGSKLTPAETWRVDVACGTINDVLPTIPYRREKDARGWTMPKDYVPLDLAALKAAWIDRDVCDDLDDPPFLVLRELRDFTKIADADRRSVERGAFCSAADWERELYRAHVILSATPLVINTALDLPPPTLKRLRLYVSRTVPAAVNARAGVVFELATIYLLRDPREPGAGEVRVRQREHWPIWTEIVQPEADLPALIGDLGVGAVQFGVGDLFTNGVAGLNDLNADLAAARLEELLAGTATVEAWSV